VEGKRGVFVATNGREGESRSQGGAVPLTAQFKPVQTGISSGELIEIVAGLDDGARVITTGATALKHGDRIVAAEAGQAESGRRGRGNGSARGSRAGS
jgi:hypothetical protein